MSVIFGFYLYTEAQLEAIREHKHLMATDPNTFYEDYAWVSRWDCWENQLTDEYGGIVVQAFEEEYDPWLEQLSLPSRADFESFARSTVLTYTRPELCVKDFPGINEVWECFSLLSPIRVERLLEVHGRLDFDELESSYPDGLLTPVHDLIAYLRSWGAVLNEALQSGKFLSIYVG